MGCAWCCTRSVTMAYYRFPSLLFTTALSPFAYNGPIMAAGTNGKIYFSDDTVTWSEKSIPVSFNGKFVDTFNNSRHGTNIITNDSAGNIYLAAVAGNNKYVLKSTDDGVTWTFLDTSDWPSQGVLEDGNIRLLKYVNGRLYLDGVDAGLSWTDDEGVTWTECTKGSQFFPLDIVYTGTAYIIVGYDSSGTKIQRSTDGTSFSNVTHTQQSGDSFRSVTIGGSTLCAVGWDGRTAYSTNDGSNWTNVQLGSSSTADATGVAWSGSEFVAVTGGSAGEVHRSTDATSWTRTVSGSTYSFGGVVWDGSQFVICGIINSTDKTIAYTSADGTASSFTQRNTDNSFSGGSLGESTSITYDSSTDTLCIAAGLNSAGEVDIQTSTDGTTWNKQVLPDLTVSDNFRLVKSDGTRFLVEAQQTGETCQIYYTDDNGDTWAESTMPAGQIFTQALHYVNFLNLWVAHFLNDTGNINQFYSSTNGETWTARTNMSISFVQGGNIADNGSVIVYVGYDSSGEDSLIYSSTNGTSWTIRTAANSFVGVFHDVVYAEGVFVAVGGDTNAGTVVIQTSTDGTIWTERLNEAWPGFTPLYKVIYNWNTEQFITYDENGNTYTSADGITWSAGDMISDFFLSEGEEDLMSTSSSTSDAFVTLVAQGNTIARSLQGTTFDIVHSTDFEITSVHIAPV